MPDISKDPLNPVQREAVEHPINSPLKVIAGPGTGKTRVLAHRFIHILKEHPKLDHRSILALTFSNKAADEMKERIVSLAKEEGIIPKASAFSQLWVGTFHSFCSRVLRENAFSAGLDPNFTIIGEADALQIYHRIVDDFVNLRLNTGGFDPSKCEHVRFEDIEFLYSPAFTFISRLKDQLIGPQDFRKITNEKNEEYYQKLVNLFNEANSKLAEKLKKYVEKISYESKFESEMVEIIYHIYKTYQGCLDNNNMLDFGDLTFRAYTLLYENDRIRRQYQERFKYILVDEFQDTSSAQLDILRLLACDDKLSNVTVVGDDKQAIYGWRNARVENIDDFKADDWGGRNLNILENYRSYGEILEVAHYSITQDSKFARQADNIKLKPTRLGMANEPKVCLISASSREREAEFVAQEIANLIEKGIASDEIAVLMRSVRSAKVYEDALRKIGIPYITIGGTGFYDRQEVRDILSYLMVVDDPFDTMALVRVLKRPPMRLDDLSLYRLCRWNASPLLRMSSENEAGGGQDANPPAEIPLTTLYDALSHASEILDDDETIGQIGHFLDLLDRIWKMIGKVSLPFLISQIIEESGYLRYIESKPPGDRERSLANLEKLLLTASAFEEKYPFADLHEFVQYLRFSMDQSLIEGEAEPKSPVFDKIPPVVQIMTVHQAKGLEFDVVFLVNAKKKSFPLDPRYPKFTLDRDNGIIINYDREGKKPFKFQPFDLKENSHLYQKYGIVDYCEKFKAEHSSEERRIWYVATTRARELLYISCPEIVEEGVGQEDSKGSKDRTNSAGEDFFREIFCKFKGEEKPICRFIRL